MILNTQHNNRSYVSRPHGRGFTLIEVLIAATIFSMALAALLSITGTGLSNVTAAKNRVTANYLAQEGIEVVRYMRDYYSKEQAGHSWASFAGQNQTGPCNTSCGVTALFPLSNVVDCSNTPSNCQVMEDSVNASGTGMYDIRGDSLVNNPSIGFWKPTIFTRYIYFQTLGTSTSDVNNNSYIVHSVVTWNQGLTANKIDMSETIYNW